ncbi:MAG: cobalamin-binding protein [Syntrophothermus sp.]
MGKQNVGLLSGLVLLALVVFVVAQSISAMAAGKFPLTVKDDWGRSLTIPREPERIISVAPSNTEILFALGLGSKVVGVTTWCDYPAEAKRIEKIGDLNPNVEKILALKPDLILAKGDLQRETVEKLTSLGLPVLVINPRTMEETLEAIRLVGDATGRVEEAKHLTAELAKRLEKVKEQVAARKAQKPLKVFIEIWNEPLMTAGPGSFLDEMIRLVGAQNVAFDAKSAWPQFSTELLLARNPDIVILTNFNKAEVLKRPAWQQIAALRKGQIYEVDTAVYTRPGPRLFDGLEALWKLVSTSK